MWCYCGDSYRHGGDVRLPSHTPSPLVSSTQTSDRSNEIEKLCVFTLLGWSSRANSTREPEPSSIHSTSDASPSSPSMSEERRDLSLNRRNLGKAPTWPFPFNYRIVDLFYVNHRMRDNKIVVIALSALRNARVLLPAFLPSQQLLYVPSASALGS